MSEVTNKTSRLKEILATNPKLQLLTFILTVIYTISPIDIIPDITPVIGWLDDIVVILAEIVSIATYIKKKREAKNGSTDQESQHS